MNIPTQVRCKDCVYAQPDKNASVYTPKRCKTCELRDDCEVCKGCERFGGCKTRLNPNNPQGCERRMENVCRKQSVKWTAYQCANHDSDYSRSLLNVGVNGDMLSRITWSGCYEGERRCEL